MLNELEFMLKTVFIIKHFFVAYLLNFFWEIWHAYYLYWGYRGKSFSEYLISEYLTLIEKVSFIDAGILTTIFLVGVLIWKDLHWGDNLWRIDLLLRRPNLFYRLAYFLTATVGVAFWIEIKGVYILEEWSYLPTMPTIFGLGLSPLLQLATTGFVAFWVLK